MQLFGNLFPRNVFVFTAGSFSLYSKSMRYLQTVYVHDHCDHPVFYISVICDNQDET